VTVVVLDKIYRCFDTWK